MVFPFKMIDLTHTITPAIATWDGGCGFQHEIKHDYDDSGIRVQKLKMNAGIGTHMDAPAHFIKNAKSIAELSLNELIAPCVRIDISTKAHANYSMSIKDIYEFEAECGLIKPGSFVIIYTSWSRFWSDPEKYRNNLSFPDISKDAAELLLDRKVSGIGIDTLSPDCLKDDFWVHKIILGAGKYIVENIANAKDLPPVGSYSLSLPIKVAEGTEAPVRLIGLIEE